MSSSLVALAPNFFMRLMVMCTYLRERERDGRERCEREVRESWGRGHVSCVTYGADISSSLMRITTSPAANGAVISSADRYCEEICPEMTVSPPGTWRGGEEVGANRGEHRGRKGNLGCRGR